MKKILLGLTLLVSLGMNAQILSVKSTTKVAIPAGMKVSTAQLSPDGKWAVISHQSSMGLDKIDLSFRYEKVTYKDIKEIKISTNTFDSEATVELPEDLTLKEGENKFEIKVTAENKKVTKVYTVIVTKEAQK